MRAPRDLRRGDTGATIELDYPDDRGTVILSVIYPENRRRRDRAVVMAVLGIGSAAPFFAWLILRHGNDAWWLTAITAVLAAFIVFATSIQYLAATQSWIFRAGPAGLDVESWRGDAGERVVRRYTAEQVADIRPGFGRYRSQGTDPIFRSWLTIETTTEDGGLRCLHNLGGDHLARIADALRKALDMPAQEWP